MSAVSPCLPINLQPAPADFRAAAAVFRSLSDNIEYTRTIGIDGYTEGYFPGFISQAQSGIDLLTGSGEHGAKSFATAGQVLLIDPLQNLRPNMGNTEIKTRLEFVENNAAALADQLSPLAPVAT